MYFKTDFCFLWKDLRYRNITNFKRFSNGAIILGQSNTSYRFSRSSLFKNKTSPKAFLMPHTNLLIRGAQNVVLYAGLQVELCEKENFRRKGIQKERTKNILSGEIFKERFTDILQTSLEQVGFSLESHNQKFSKNLTKESFVKSALWKNLQNHTNRRFPYFTRFFFCFPFCFDPHSGKDRSRKENKQVKTKNKSAFFPWSFQVSNLHNYSLQALRKLSKAGEEKRNDLKKARAKSFSQSKTLLGNYKSPATKQSEQIVRKAHYFGVRFHCYTLIAKSRKQLSKKRAASFKQEAFLKETYKRVMPKGQRHVHEKFYHQRAEKKNGKRLWLTKRAPSQEYGEKKSITPNKIALTIKIGDYVAAGDIIGENNFNKKRLLENNTSLLAQGSNVPGFSNHRPKFFEQIEDLMPILTSRKHCFVYKGLKALPQNGTKRKKTPTPIILGFSGRVVTISKTQVVVQKTQPVLFYKSANLHVKKGNWVKQGSPILTLTHQTLITGDIVQGIPRIEQLFEAFTSPPPAFKEKGDFTKFKDGYNTLHSQVRDIFRNNWLKNRLPIAVRKSLEEIGYILVEMIQKVYLSQGVLISDKHIEIVVRQIASKGQILDSGTTGLFLEEVLPIRQIENANLTTPGKKCLYVPAVMGLTAAALNSDSFISAASFQETTRVLSRDAVVGKSDFLRGLKEKVVIGDLISAGTGLDLYFIYTTMLTG